MQYQKLLGRTWRGRAKLPATRMWSVPFPLLIVLGLLCLQGFPGALQVGAQESTEIVVGPRWSLAILTGMAGPGPAGDFGDALIRAGYDETSEGGWFSSPSKLIQHPKEPSLRRGFEFEVGYRLSPMMILAISAGETDFDGTIGYRDLTDEGGLWVYPTLAASLKHLSPALVYRFRGIRASLGPSLVQVRTWMRRGKKDEEDTMRIGASAGVAFSQKLWRAFNLELRARYRLFGSVDVGPYDWETGDIQEFNASFNHWQIGFGFGLHLGV